MVVATFLVLGSLVRVEEVADAGRVLVPFGGAGHDPDAGEYGDLMPRRSGRRGVRSSLMLLKPPIGQYSGIQPTYPRSHDFGRRPRWVGAPCPQVLEGQAGAVGDAVNVLPRALVFQPSEPRGGGLGTVPLDVGKQRGAEPEPLGSLYPVGAEVGME